MHRNMYSLLFLIREVIDNFTPNRSVKVHGLPLLKSELLLYSGWFEAVGNVFINIFVFVRRSNSLRIIPSIVIQW